MSVFFSRFMGNEAQCGTNKSREPRSGSRAICLFRTAIHFPWTEKKRSQFTRFVCSALRFITNEPRKKDTHSLYLQCLQQRPLLKFSEQSKKFKFPAEIGHLTLFQDKTILAYSFRQNSAGSCRRFCRLFIDKLIKTKAWLVYHYIYQHWYRFIYTSLRCRKWE